MPVFMVEANYEFEHNYRRPEAGPYILRRQEYWSILSGAAGQLYGNKYTWQFIDRWKDHLDTLGSRQISYLIDLFGPRAWYDLVPDQEHRLVVDGYGAYTTEGGVAESEYLTAARSPDGTLGIAYVPTRRRITVDLSQMAGTGVGVRWYDPSNGTFTPIPASPYATSGTAQLSTPGKNGDGDDDWVLVLETLN
jgi:Putative collagen-binding domain of a collagenase/Protein of unknown function (DUF4038)